MAQRTGPLEKTTQARGPLNIVLHVRACLFFFLSFKRVDDRLSGPFYFFLFKYGDNTSFFSLDSGHHCDGLKIRAMGFNLQSPFFNFFKAKTHKTSPKTCINQFSNPINPKKQLISQNKIE